MRKSKPKAPKKMIRADLDRKISLKKVDSESRSFASYLCPLRRLREESGISQRALAEKLGLMRNHLVRLESKKWEQVTLKDVALFSKALGCKVRDIVERFDNATRGESLSRASMANPYYRLTLVSGVEVYSLRRDPGVQFVGVLVMDPQKQFSGGDIPKRESFFGFVIEGILHMAQQSQEHIFKENDSFFLKETNSFELYNPHQFHKVTMLIITSPPLIQLARPDASSK